MRHYTVFYDSWQLECCGTPFTAGDKIKWVVRPNNGLYTAVDLSFVDYCYEAHSEYKPDFSVIEGIVTDIRLLCQRYEPDKDRPRLLLPVSGELFPTERAEGFDEAPEGMQASGYVVGLTDCTLRPARKEEITFQ
ncbi:MAG: hypothetical protein IKR76_10245 [Ruminococcus sp.]|nr:hypothetical protein [Ruminococcus sp.]